MKDKIKNIPESPGVYKFFSKKELIYIGKAKNLFNRVKSYTNLNNHTYRIKKMISETRSMEITITSTEAEALLLEANLIKKNKPKYNIAMRDDKSYAKIIAEPLEKGYGLTLGNSLRRILLSSIRGAAVTSIQIDGVLHEFTSIKGVREDVTDIVLNVKSLALKSNS